MAITAGTILEYSSDGTAFQELVAITNYPDLGSAPAKLDNTTLSAINMKTSELGLQEAPDLTFEANYSVGDYKKILALKSKYTFRLRFGDTDGAFKWQGSVQVYANAGAVDEVRKMTIVTSAESEIEFVETIA